MAFHNNNHLLHVKKKTSSFNFFFTETLPLAKKNFFGLLQIFKHVKSHLRLMKVLKPFENFHLIKTRTSFIYLFDYISRKFSTKDRLAILTYHYYFLNKIFSAQSRCKLFNNGIRCWHEFAGNEKLSIQLKHSGYLEFEGSLSLLFYVDKECIYTMSFTICPGNHFDMPDEKIIFISLLQGKIGKMNDITKVTKHVNNLIPSTILMSVVEGFAHAAGIKKIIGIGAKNQLSTEIVSNTHIDNYDAYWASQGGIITNDGNYLFSCPLRNKPIELIKAKYKGRTIIKRAKRAEIAANCCTTITNYIRKNYTEALAKNGTTETIVQKKSIAIFKLASKTN